MPPFVVDLRFICSWTDNTEASEDGIELFLLSVFLFLYNTVSDMSAWVNIRNLAPCFSSA